MAPFYRGYQANFRLSSDDIRGIQRLYGSNTNTPDSPSPSEPDDAPSVPGGDAPDFCTAAQFDAVTMHDVDGVPRTFFFKGAYYARLTKVGEMASGHPRRISDDWPGLPSNIDAALYWAPVVSYRDVDGVRRRTITRTSRTYFFRGSQYWRYENMRLLAGYPKSISSGFRGLPDNIDAAFVWGANDKTYFIKGTSKLVYQMKVRGMFSQDR